MLFRSDLHPSFQYYVVYYTNNTTIPFDQWSSHVVHTYPFSLVSLSGFSDASLFVRVATVNAKGSILSDFSRIHRNRSHDGSLVTLDQFHCLADDTHQLVLLRWSMNPSSHSHVHHFLLSYLDVADGDADLMRIVAIPTSSVSIDQQSSFD